MTKPLPCPFCGGEATLDAVPTGIMARIYCRNDDCLGPRTTAQLKEDAVAQWNKRPDAWQDIITAPENHFPVLVYGRCGKIVAFRDVTWTWWPSPATEQLFCTPTHWRPLPEAPTVTRHDGKGGAA